MDGSYWVIHTRAVAGGPGVVAKPIVKEGMEKEQITVSHFSNELNISL